MISVNFSNSETKFVNIDGFNLAYRTFGEGKPLLFYNRFRGILDTWDPAFLDRLAGDYRVILFDYPGIGDSEGELSSDITEVARSGVKLMDALGHELFYVAGWSYGGLVAQAALFTHQSRVLKTVLIGTNPPGINAVPFEESFFERALKPTNSFEDEAVIFFEPSSEKSLAAAKASYERIFPRLDRNKIPATMEKFQKYFAGSAMMKEDKQNYRGQYQTLNKPVLIISSDHDISFAVENWFPLLRKAPSVQHLIIHDTGHGLQHQHPQLIADYIKVFLS